MRGSDKRSGSMFSYVDLEVRVRRDHPLRAIRQLADAALESLTAAFGELYARTGRPSIPPEMLLRAMLLQAFYTIRSERLLMERLEFDLLFRWFVGLSIDDPADLGKTQAPQTRQARTRLQVRRCSDELGFAYARLVQTSACEVDGSLFGGAVWWC